MNTQFTSLKKQITKWLAICLLMITTFSASNAQVTIPNPGFEIINGYPAPYHGGALENFCYGWKGIQYYSAGYLTFCHLLDRPCTMPRDCCSWPADPLPMEGDGYIFLINAKTPISTGENDGLKTYAYTQFSSPLVAGVTYTVSFSALSTTSMGKQFAPIPTSGTNVSYFCEDLPVAERGRFGVCFSTVEPVSTDCMTNTSPNRNSGLHNSFAPNGRVYIPASSSVYTSHEWTPFTFSYTASGGEKFLIIGQFLEGGSTIRNPYGNTTVGPIAYNFFLVDGIGFSTCQAGTGPVVLDNNTLTNTCPNTTVNLNSLYSGAVPSGSSLVWFTNATHSGAAYATPAAATAGTYYAFFYDATSNCYNTATSDAVATVFINGLCCNSGTAQVSLFNGTVSNICPATTVNLNSLLSGTAPTGSSLVWFTTADHSGTPYATPTTAATGTYYAFFYDAVNGCYNTTLSTAKVVVNNSSCAAGSIDCSKTAIITAPVAGVPSQQFLVVTINVTAAGCFSPLSVSGSGMSLPANVTQVCASATGVQQLKIPIQYDGSPLGTLNFTIGNAGSCTADLTVLPKTKEVNVWTLDNCTLVNAAPALK